MEETSTKSQDDSSISKEENLNQIELREVIEELEEGELVEEEYTNSNEFSITSDEVKSEEAPTYDSSTTQLKTKSSSDHQHRESSVNSEVTFLSLNGLHDPQTRHKCNYPRSVEVVVKNELNCKKQLFVAKIMPKINISSIVDEEELEEGELTEEELAEEELADKELIDKELKEEELTEEELAEEELADKELTDKELKEEELTEEELAEEELADKELIDKELKEEELSDKELTDKELKEEELTEEELTDEKLADKELAEEELTEEELTDEELTEEELTDEELTDEELTDEELTDEELTEDDSTEEKLTKVQLCESNIIMPKNKYQQVNLLSSLNMENHSEANNDKGQSNHGKMQHFEMAIISGLRKIRKETLTINEVTEPSKKAIHAPSTIDKANATIQDHLYESPTISKEADPLLVCAPRMCGESEPFVECPNPYIISGITRLQPGKKSDLRDLITRRKRPREASTISVKEKASNECTSETPNLCEDSEPNEKRPRLTSFDEVSLQKLLSVKPFPVRALLDKQSDFKGLISDDAISQDNMCLAIQLMNLVANSKNCEVVRNLLTSIFEICSFIIQLCNFVISMKNSIDIAEQCLPLIINVIEKFLLLEPQKVPVSIFLLTDVCYSIFIQSMAKEPSKYAALQKSICGIQYEIQELRIKEEITKKKFESHVRYLEDIPLYSVFRTTNVLPTCQDLLPKNKTFLPKNIISGPYENSDHYLDVHFSLLREDIIRPLREGLNQYYQDFSKKNRDVRVYENVYFRECRIDGKDFIYYVTLQLSKKFRAVKSKALMFGNILCLSHDNFGTMIIASIYNRDELSNNTIGIKLITDHRMPIKFSESKIPFTMIESKAYFVPYVHTLKALQKMVDVPFYDSIVKVEESNKRPAYLNNNPSYDFNSVIPAMNFLPEVPLLSGLDSWPSCNDLQLDESQRQAIHDALTRQLAIIQGPPGTGKTYVGLQIIKLLLANKSNGKCDPIKFKDRPILVVCYTNHALDQFLEGISDFTDNIVRIGSRSKKQELERFNMKNYIKASRGKLPSSAKYREAFSVVKSLKTPINNLSLLLKSIHMVGIVKLFFFNEFSVIPSHFIEQLQGDKSTLCDYLFKCFTDIATSDAWKSSGVISKVISLVMNHLPNGNYDTSQNFNNERNSSSDFNTTIFEKEQNNRMVDDDLELDELSLNIKEDIDKEEFFDLLECNIKAEIESLKQKSDQSSYNHSYYKNLYELETKLGNLYWGWTVEHNPVECSYWERTCDIYSLNSWQRWKLYKYWKEKLISNIKQRKTQLEEEYIKAANELDSLRDNDRMAIIKKVDVVGMTTTAAAQLNNILNKVSPSVVIVEEAAEILEAHVVSSLSPKCQHLILIGDHKQLKPKTSVFNLATKYHLDVSLFERLINNGLKYTSLEFQHRMKPCISSLLVPIIYPELKDHSIVLSHPKILGIEKDVFFLDHSHTESKGKDEDASVENRFEAKFAIALCCYLVFQGYGTKDITIVTPYYGQFRLLKKKQSENPACHGVSISILDDYQGEESNIIILSLVRSNLKGTAGFLKCNNRTCVAISRAKNGFYMIGNMTLFANVSSLWDQIRQKLVLRQSIGKKMILVCKNHPEETIEVGSADDIIAKRPMGACMRMCNIPLPNCKHDCPQKCHLQDYNHSTVKCKQRCERILCELGHPCPKLCSKKCPSCRVPVIKVLACNHTHEISCFNISSFQCPTIVERKLPGCQHTAEMRCSEYSSNIICKQRCERSLCDLIHPCPNFCSEECSPCKVRIKKVLPCHHVRLVPCAVPIEEFRCNILVEKELPGCKHVAKGAWCSESVNDIKCRNTCKIRLDCGHRCKFLCHVKKDPEHDKYKCYENCERIPQNCSSNHPCRKKCLQPCGDCDEIITRNLPCGHTKRKVRCGLLPEKIRCYEKCKNTLACSHPCPKYCYETCGGCKVLVEKTVPGCQHIVKVECGVADPSGLCSAKCLKTLECGHPCPNQCNELCSSHCLEVVPSKKKCPRNHTVMLDCSTVRSSSDQQNDDDDELVWSLCSETCGMTLNCEHTCQGKCGQCYNGRLHTKCMKQCGKALVCGHICKSPCSSMCPPCQAVCELKCEHSSCIKKCGVPCINCKQICPRRCRHTLCLKKCDEPCVSNGCLKPCLLNLSCGHPCIGYCGEPCPVLCKICNKEEVIQIFFGNEDEDSARFVMLEDCRHVFESKGIEQWLNNSGSEIGMKKCPKCIKPIYNTKRFQKWILNDLKDVQKVKTKFFSLQDNSIGEDKIPRQKTFNEWKNVVENLSTKLGFDSNFSRIKKKTNLCDMEFSLCCFRIEFLEMVSDVKQKLEENYQFTPILKVKLNNLVKKIFDISLSIPDQMRDEAICELRRIQTLASINQLKGLNSNKSSVMIILGRIRAEMDPSAKFSSEAEIKVVALLKEAKRHIGPLMITDEERKMIVSAMGFKQGHWYKCPNGHVYTVGECGGPMQESTCPDCKAKIGGTQHRLTGGNRLASEMDGASRPAYPSVL